MSSLEAFMNEYEGTSQAQQDEVPYSSHANHFNQGGDDSPREEQEPDSEPEMMEEPEYKPVARKIRRQNLTKPIEATKPTQAPRNQPDGHSRLMNNFKAEVTAQLAAVKRVGKTEEALDMLFDWYGQAADKLTAEMEQASEAMEQSEYDKVSKQFNRFMGQQAARVNRIAN
jgi:hypothetical protein